MSFLEGIAEEILERHKDDLKDIVIIVPAKRAGLFLKQQLAVKSGRPIIAPKTMVLPQWVAWLSGSVLANKLEQTFLLYDAYTEVMGSAAEPFEQFARWSATALTDLSDIDQYMVNDATLFSDLRDVREIENWSFSEAPYSEAQERYMAFWNELGKICVGFRNIQEKAGRYTYAHITKKLASDVPDLPESVTHFWFVGLSSLSKAEQTLVNSFVDRNVATCRWDADAYYVNNPLHEAGQFIRQRMKKEKIPLSDLLSRRTMQVMAYECTTSFGQVLALSEHLGKLTKKQLEASVIVLADENLLYPFIEHLPELSVSVNIAMGVSLRHTSIFKLLVSIIRMHVNAARRGSGSFYHTDVIEFILQPALFPYLGRNALTMRDKIVSGRRVEVGPADWKTFSTDIPQLGKLYFVIDTVSTSSENLIVRLKKLCAELLETESSDILFHEGITRMMKVLDQLEVNVREREYLKNISSAEVFFHQLVSTETMSFEGEAFAGLQVLGMVETRALDFENVFILGANEDVFPGKLNDPSLIPWDLRRLHAMPTISEKEAMYSYTFYRLIQRAENVSMYYSSITADFKGTEQSRYITQIELELIKKNTLASLQKRKVILPEKMEKREGDFVNNDSWARSRLDGLFSYGISPSAINCYLKCPLDFYYKYVIGIGEKLEMEEVIDVSTFGSIVHHVLEHFFVNFIGSYPGDDELTEFKVTIDKHLEAAIEKHYTNARMDVGFNYLARSVARTMLLKIIDFELRELEARKQEGKVMKILAVERPLKRQVNTSAYGWNKQVVLKGKADRIDEVAGTTRIVDYKTGKVGKSEVLWNDEDVFSGKKPRLLQLISYMYMYCENGHDPGNVQAALHSLKNFGEGSFPLLLASGTSMSAEKLDQFESDLMEWVRSVYSSERFEHDPNSKFCEYCRHE